MKILLTDDSCFMRNMLKVMLSKHLPDAVFIEANNGEESLKKYIDEKPDLVLMDMTMPIMDGIEAVSKIKKLDDDCKVIMVSAMGQKLMILDAIKTGTKDFIIKPVVEERLLEAITKNM